MGTTSWGDYDYYFADGNLDVSYMVKVACESEPAEDADVSQARIFYGEAAPTTPMPEPDERIELVKNGCSNLQLDMSTYTPQLHSPLLVQFYFQKDFTSGPKAGNTEINEDTVIGVLLAEAEVGAIHAYHESGNQVVFDAKPGEKVSLEVGEWGGLVFEEPHFPKFEGGIFPQSGDPNFDRLPTGVDAEVEWFADGVSQGKGGNISYTVPEGTEGQEIVVTAYRCEGFGIDAGGSHAAMSVVVPKLTVLAGDKSSAASTDVMGGEEKGTPFTVKVEPAGVEGELEWSTPSDKISLGDGSTNMEKVPGDSVVVHGLKGSDAEKDVELLVTFTAKATQKQYQASHKVTVKPWPATIKGKLFYNRKWDWFTGSAVAAVKEFLPEAKLELWTQPKGKAALEKTLSGNTTDDGSFEFKGVAECTKAAIRIFTEQHAGKKVLVEGLTNAHTEADFEVKKDKTAWHQLDLDLSKKGKEIAWDAGEVEIKKAKFVELCDCYKSLWHGWTELKKLAGVEAPLCKTNYPQPTTKTSWYSGGELYLLNDDLKDRCVILHEYGHFIDAKLAANPTNPGYEYNDDSAKQHGRTTKEYYAAAWKEGFATFFSCALTGSSVYHDHYDGNMTYNLASDNTTVGPHSEGSIQEALWRVWKTHGVDFKTTLWKAFSDTSKHSVDSAYSFWQNWKDLGLPKRDKLVEAYKKFGMEYHYTYPSAKWKCAAAFDASKSEFKTVDELWNHSGKLGSGTKADYYEEFYNINKKDNAGQLDTGSAPATPKVKAGRSYIVPQRVQVS